MHAHLGGYFGMVKRLDDCLGRIRDALKSLGQLENTVILFLSDHGCHFKTRNGEYKRSGHEASIRIPMMAHGGPFTGGGRVDALASLVDVAPTLLDAAGVEPPAEMQGRSLLPLVRRDPGAPRVAPRQRLLPDLRGDLGPRRPHPPLEGHLPRRRRRGGGPTTAGSSPGTTRPSCTTSTTTRTS